MQAGTVTVTEPRSFFPSNTPADPPPSISLNLAPHLLQAVPNPARCSLACCLLDAALRVPALNTTQTINHARTALALLLAQAEGVLRAAVCSAVAEGDKAEERSRDTYAKEQKLLAERKKHADKWNFGHGTAI